LPLATGQLERQAFTELLAEPDVVEQSARDSAPPRPVEVGCPPMW